MCNKFLRTAIIVLAQINWLHLQYDLTTNQMLYIDTREESNSSYSNVNIALNGKTLTHFR